LVYVTVPLAFIHIINNNTIYILSIILTYIFMLLSSSTTIDSLFPAKWFERIRISGNKTVPLIPRTRSIVFGTGPDDSHKCTNNRNNRTRGKHLKFEEIYAVLTRPGGASPIEDDEFYQYLDAHIVPVFDRVLEKLCCGAGMAGKPILNYVLSGLLVGKALFTADGKCTSKKLGAGHWEGGWCLLGVCSVRDMSDFDFGRWVIPLPGMARYHNARDTPQEFKDMFLMHNYINDGAASEKTTFHGEVPHSTNSNPKNTREIKSSIETNKRVVKKRKLHHKQIRGRIGEISLLCALPGFGADFLTAVEDYYSAGPEGFRGYCLESIESKYGFYYVRGYRAYDPRTQVMYEPLESYWYVNRNTGARRLKAFLSFASNQGGLYKMMKPAKSQT
jgi:hypothetical protein